MDNGVQCRHQPRCPAWDAADAAAAHVVADRGEQGWSLLCNGIVLFDDLSALAPDGSLASLPPQSRARVSQGSNSLRL